MSTPNKKKVAGTPLKGERSTAANWIDIQKKTFISWLNIVLRKCEGAKPIADLTDETIKNGTAIAYVIEYFARDKRKFEKPSPNARTVLVLDFVNKMFKNLRELGVRVTASPEDIVNGNEKMTLGLVWSLIKCFQFQSVEEEETGGSSLKSNMLTWMREELAQYGYPIKNFTKDFADGLLLCSLVHKLVPAAIDMDKVQSMTPEERIKYAVAAADASCQIPALIDAEDIAQGGDEQSMLTYLSYFKLYAREKKLQQAEKMTVEELREQYNSTTRELQDTKAMLDSVKTRLQAEEERAASVEHKYFYATAIGIKSNQLFLGESVVNCDLQDLYEEIRASRIPVEKWPMWLSSRMVRAYADRAQPEQEPEEEPQAQLQESPAADENEQVEHATVRLLEKHGPVVSGEALDVQFQDRQVLSSLLSKWCADDRKALTVVRGKSRVSGHRLPSIDLTWASVERITRSLSALLTKNAEQWPRDKPLSCVLLVPSSHTAYAAEVLLTVLSCWRIGVGVTCLYTRSETAARDFVLLNKTTCVVCAVCCDVEKDNAKFFSEILAPCTTWTPAPLVLSACTLCCHDDKQIESFPYELTASDYVHYVPSCDLSCLCETCDSAVPDTTPLSWLFYQAMYVSECVLAKPAEEEKPAADGEKAQEEEVEGAPTAAAEGEQAQEAVEGGEEQDKSVEESEEAPVCWAYDITLPTKAGLDVPALLANLATVEATATSSSVAYYTLTAAVDSLTVHAYSHRALCAAAVAQALSFSLEMQDSWLLDSPLLDTTLGLVSQLAPALFLGARVVVVGDGVWSDAGLGQMRALREGKPTVWNTRSSNIAYLLSQPGWSSSGNELACLKTLVLCDGAAVSFNSTLCSRVILKAMQHKHFAVAACDACEMIGLLSYRFITNKNDVENWESLGGQLLDQNTVTLAEVEDGKGHVTVTGPQATLSSCKIDTSSVNTAADAALVVARLSPHTSAATGLVGKLSAFTEEDLVIKVLQLSQ